MDQRQRTGLAGGILLIVLGACLLLVRMSPDFQALLPQNLGWPLILVGVGALLLVIGLISGNAAMAVPACIVAGIGLILNYQVATGDWGSWLYLWALIPFFAGLGTVLAGILGMNPHPVHSRRALDDGGQPGAVPGFLFDLRRPSAGRPLLAGAAHRPGPGGTDPQHLPRRE